MMVNEIGSGYGSTRRIDAQNDCLDFFVCAYPVNLPLNEPITFHDHALNRNDGNFVTSKLGLKGGEGDGILLDPVSGIVSPERNSMSNQQQRLNPDDQKAN